MLAITTALLVALVRPLPSEAGSSAPSSAGTRPTRHHHKRRRRLQSKPADRTGLFGRRVVKYARHFLGVPYRYGGSSPRSGFDCSGFVRFVYSHFGISLPHSSFADLWRGRHVGRRHLQEGDLVFFAGAGHVGIYVGSNRFIHAPHTGTVVRISTMTGWYGSEYDGARRLHGR